uniref:Protein kinase domain-containing protein n=1 Tax=Maylandia zebra TaxID=106582 RepID=A0A3P9BA11_9CICH
NHNYAMNNQSYSALWGGGSLFKVKGSILGNHYKVEAFLGEGGFGIVAKCRDTMTNRAVAIKVNKSDPDILQQAKLEIFILEQLRRLDPDAANIVKWNGFFHDGEWVCLKFELLDQCLWDYIGDRKNQGLPISEVRPILGHLTNALSHLGSVGIVRADLKPGNIMVVNRYESPVKVRLIDFGLACPASAVMPGDRVGTVGYSAPEVMLGLPYNEASDMWSLGLVAVELGTGVPLYPGNEDYDVLKFIIETQGQPPDHVLDSGVYIMMFRRGPENGQRLFVSLIKQILASDANQRITLLEVLRHPFFNPKSSPCIGMSAERPQNPCKAWFLSVFRAAGEKKVKNLFQSNLELLLFLFSPFNIRPFNPSGSQIQTGNQLDYSHCRHKCLCSTFAIFQYCFYAVFFFAPIYIIGLSAIGGINSIYILQRKTAWLGK